MRTLVGIILLAAVSGPAFAAYDNTWYQEDFWTGEYPTGFSVVKSGVSVPARAAMDLDAEKNISCELPKRAVYHPWNSHRKATYRSASKIIVLTAKEDFRLGDGTEEPDTRVTVKKGETLEYLMNNSEGMFTVRYNGKKYTGDQALFTSVEAFDESQFQEHDWVKVPCLNSESAWIYMGDISTINDAGDIVYLPGLDSWGRGMRKYGRVRDLPRK